MSLDDTLQNAANDVEAELAGLEAAMEAYTKEHNDPRRKAEEEKATHNRNILAQLNHETEQALQDYHKTNTKRLQQDRDSDLDEAAPEPGPAPKKAKRQQKANPHGGRSTTSRTRRSRTKP